MVRNLTGKHPKYFEAIIQIREVSEEVIDWIEREIIRAKIILAKVEKVKHIKDAYDYYLADNNQARQLGTKLQQKFGGHYLVTSTLHTTIDSKEKYRTTHLFREAPFRKGDIVTYQDKKYKIMMMMKDIFLQKVKTGEKVHVKFKDMKNIKKVVEE